MKQRQIVMVLYTKSSALDSEVVGWATYDGTGKKFHHPGDLDDPPYKTGLEAMLDGWRVIQISQLVQPYPGAEYNTSFLPFEIVLEQLIEVE